VNDRPFRDQSDRSLSKLLSDALEANKPKRGPIQPTGIRDLTDPLAYGMGQNVETEFRIGADGRPEAVTRLVLAPAKTSVRNAGESEMAWLKRRVNEIRWRPTR